MRASIVSHDGNCKNLGMIAVLTRYYFLRAGEEEYLCSFSYHHFNKEYNRDTHSNRLLHSLLATNLTCGNRLHLPLFRRFGIMLPVFQLFSQVSGSKMGSLELLDRIFLRCHSTRSI